MRNQRQVYGQTLVELGHGNDRIVVLEADLGKSTMSCLFQAEFPDRYFEMGIAEANMVSFAAGLSLTDRIAFVNTFAVFATGRPYDQIRQGVCIGKLNVKIVGSSAGLSDFGDGATHQAIEDVALMRAIPNMTVLVPCDGSETALAVRAAAAHDGPVYLRICRNDMEDVLPEGAPFEIGMPRVLREGHDIVLFAMGIMVATALKAAQTLEAEGIHARVVNVSTIKPLNTQRIIELSRDCCAVLVAEEHTGIGGLTGAILEALRTTPVPVESISIGDQFGQSAESHEELLVRYGLTAGDVHRKACALVRQFKPGVQSADLFG